MEMMSKLCCGFIVAVSGLLIGCADHQDAPGADQQDRDSASSQRDAPDTDTPGPDTGATRDSDDNAGSDTYVRRDIAIDPEPPERENRSAVHASLMDAESDAADMTLDDFQERYAVPFNEALGYAPLDAAHLDLIQDSALALSEPGLEMLSENGFAVLGDLEMPTFFFGYEQIYHADLPVYITADAILNAIHRSYDRVLMTVEALALVDGMQQVIRELRDGLADDAGAALGQTARTDLDLYLTVAHSLIEGETLAPLFDENSAAVVDWVGWVEAADGIAERELFGSARLMDASQFKPRGHYVGGFWNLKAYFRAMMWLGRIDFRLVETLLDGSQGLNRRQLNAMLLAHSLMSDTARETMARMNAAIDLFVGVSDYMTLWEIEPLLADLGVSEVTGVSEIDDETVKRVILENGYGAQRIASHLMIGGLGGGTTPLNASFALFGQRYIVDSEVFSNLVYDRLQDGAVRRMMPDPLDAAFAVMENDHAGALLTDELAHFGYAKDLHMARVLVNANAGESWGDSLYNLWVGSLRTLSPDSAAVADPAAAGMPAVTGTEPWARRILNTQLGSWSQLRHDTLLYAKQSYTGMPICEYPDAYVDPYPEFYETLVGYTDRGLRLTPLLGDLLDDENAAAIDTYFLRTQGILSVLAGMAAQQRTGEPFTDEQMAFVNDAVYLTRESAGCASVDVPNGWYPDLFFHPPSAIEMDPVIADVHTQPVDEVGNTVGDILHVATGKPRLMAVTVDTCTGPKAYMGVVFAYFEQTFSGFHRMTDQEWADLLGANTPADVPWMADLVVR